jgi:DNA-binding GntR family transcriptional regulator
LATLEHVSLPEAVSKALRRRILNNELPAGTRLVEANLAAEFGVSRGTIRDAMRGLQAEGLIAIVPRRYSVVTRMSREDAEDVCFARYALEDASIENGLGPHRRDLARALRLALDHMSVAARTDDMDALVESDTRFHELLVDISGRRRLKELWSMLNSQMGALMRAEIERQDIGLLDAVERHRGIWEAVNDADLDRLRAELADHYLGGYPGYTPRRLEAVRQAAAERGDGLTSAQQVPPG